MRATSHDDVRREGVSTYMAKIERDLVVRLVDAHLNDETCDIVETLGLTPDDVNAMLHAFASVRNTWFNSNAKASESRKTGKAILIAATRDPEIMSRIKEILANQNREAR